ncbi:hypothetical protein [Myxococcus eversor]|nr:hypothetical protein [Myxococcus eversor]
MNCLGLRAALSWMAAALLLTACGGRDATGECRGKHLGVSVNWPIDGEASVFVDLNIGDTVFLTYLPRGHAGLKTFGAEINLLDGESSTSRTVALINRELRLEPEDNPLVVNWEGTRDTASESGKGFHAETGVPARGSVTIDVVDDEHAAGRFVYHYENGDELTCTFDAPTPEAAEGIWGGGGDGDDDDD